MRKLYFSVAGFLGIVGIIICFQNMMIQSQGMMIFFETITGSVFWPLLFILLVGTFAGILVGLALKTPRAGTARDLDEDF